MTKSHPVHIVQSRYEVGISGAQKPQEFPTGLAALIAGIGYVLMLIAARKLKRRGWKTGKPGTFDTPIELRLERYLQPIKWPTQLDKQLSLFDGGTLITIPDFAFRESRIAIYCDGVAWHGNKKTLYQDAQKRNTLTKNGWMVLVFWGAEIYKNPWRCVNTVKEAVAVRHGIKWCHKCQGSGTVKPSQWECPSCHGKGFFR